MCAYIFVPLHGHRVRKAFPVLKNAKRFQWLIFKKLQCNIVMSSQWEYTEIVKSSKQRCSVFEATFLSLRGSFSNRRKQKLLGPLAKQPANTHVSPLQRILETDKRARSYVQKSTFLFWSRSRYIIIYVCWTHAIWRTKWLSHERNAASLRWS